MRTRNKVILSIVGALFILAVIGSAFGNGDSKKPSGTTTVAAPATTTAAEPEPTTAASDENVDPTMGPRTRGFLEILRACQNSARALPALLGNGSLDSVALATEVAQAKSNCEQAKSLMFGFDDTHFSDQALDAEVAVDDYISGIGKIADYVDTGTPSDVPAAVDKLSAATAEAANAIGEINTRRQIYGFGNL